MLNGSLPGFVIGVSASFAAGAFLTGAGAEDCAGADLVGVWPFATGAVNIATEKQITHTHE